MVYGRFYFKQTQNGNLIGEFTNQLMSQINTECANVITQFDLPFIGRFISTWHNEESLFSTLEISQKENTSNRIFILKWLSENKCIFSGEGFLVDGMLVGSYMDSELLNITIKK